MVIDLTLISEILSRPLKSSHLFLCTNQALLQAKQPELLSCTCVTSFVVESATFLLLSEKFILLLCVGEEGQLKHFKLRSHHIYLLHRKFLLAKLIQYSQI